MVEIWVEFNTSQRRHKLDSRHFRIGAWNTSQHLLYNDKTHIMILRFVERGENDVAPFVVLKSQIYQL